MKLNPLKAFTNVDGKSNVAAIVGLSVDQLVVDLSTVELSYHLSYGHEYTYSLCLLGGGEKLGQPILSPP